MWLEGHRVREAYASVHGINIAIGELGTVNNCFVLRCSCVGGRPSAFENMAPIASCVISRDCSPQPAPPPLPQLVRVSPTRELVENTVTKKDAKNGGPERKIGIFPLSPLRPFFRSRTKMTRRRKTTAAASPAPSAGPSAQELASQLGGLALGRANQPQPPSAENGAAASSAAKGAASSDAGPSSSVASSSVASL